MEIIAQQNVSLSVFLDHMRKSGIDSKKRHEAVALRKILRRHFSESTIRVLDVGSGTGRTVDFFEPRCHVTHIEPNQSYYEYSIAQHPGKTFVQSSLLSYPLDEKFDAVVMLYAFLQMFNLDYQEILLCNAFDRLKKGGICIVDILPRVPSDAINQGEYYIKKYGEGASTIPYFFPVSPTFYEEISMRRGLQVDTVRYTFCPLQWRPFSLPFPHKFLVFKN